LHLALEDFYRSTAPIARRRAGASASQEAAP
jgi:hypothetical protein